VDGSTQATDPSPQKAGGNVRWVICALLFFATTINYIDRQVIGILKPTLQNELGWSEVDYGMIVFWFQAAYAIGLLACGPIVDKIGSKMGYAAAITVWSLAALFHALVRSPGGFSVARFALGLGEAANFPAAIKSVAEWFPKKQRALAAGILNAGANVGAIATPIVVPIITLAYGWRAAFIVTGMLGFVWLAAWLIFYRAPEHHPRVSAQELAYIRADQDNDAGTAPIPWRRLFRYRGTWAFVTAKFLTDPVWYLFLFWLPDFFAKRHGLDLKTFGPPLIAVYLLADVGSIGGGWLSSDQARLQRQRGPQTGAARLRDIGAADHAGQHRVQSARRRRDHRPRCRRAPGMVVEPVYHGLRHLPQELGRLGHGYRRRCRRGRRDDHGALCRACA
jgi:ACS family hexuronate transporter-like MFS transporter